MQSATLSLMHDLHEEKRLELLWEKARNSVSTIQERLSEKSGEINNERTQYFEKIALGCGATIALVVSFVGAKAAGKLQPTWMLRSSLILLALAMICAMYRNWRYPFYVLASLYRQLDKAMLEEAKSKRNFFAVANVRLLETGAPVDLAQSEENFLKTESVLIKKIDQFDRQERRVWNELKFVEPSTLILTTLGLCGLIALAWLNF
jgi:hypothetical protein